MMLSLGSKKMQKKTWTSLKIPLCNGHCRIKSNTSLTAPPLLLQIHQGPSQKTVSVPSEVRNDSLIPITTPFFHLFKHQHRLWFEQTSLCPSSVPPWKDSQAAAAAPFPTSREASHMPLLHFLVPANLLSHWFPFPFILHEPKEATTNAILVKISPQFHPISYNFIYISPANLMHPKWCLPFPRAPFPALLMRPLVTLCTTFIARIRQLSGFFFLFSLYDIWILLWTKCLQRDLCQDIR